MRASMSARHSRPRGLICVPSESDTIILFLLSKANTSGGSFASGSGNQPVSVSVDATGAYVYVVTKNNNTVWIYPVKADGTLNQPAVQLLGNAPVQLVTASN